jgi:site-specific recombinase XerD
MLAKIAENNGPAAANRTRASVSAYFSWLMKEGLASSNPFANTNKAPENASRDRTPTDDELAEIWRIRKRSASVDLILIGPASGSGMWRPHQDTV